MEPVFSQDLLASELSTLVGETIIAECERSITPWWSRGEHRRYNLTMVDPSDRFPQSLPSLTQALHICSGAYPDFPVGTVRIEREPYGSNGILEVIRLKTRPLYLEDGTPLGRIRASRSAFIEPGKIEVLPVIYRWTKKSTRNLILLDELLLPRTPHASAQVAPAYGRPSPG